MTPVERTYYQLAFNERFLRSAGGAFQDFFTELMELVHPEDFERVRPWGKQGDQKCDGYLPSSKTVFQCYGPHGMKDATVLQKIDEDFRGAVEHWPNMKEWIFVHNDTDGLSANVTKKLEQLRAEHPDVKIPAPWTLGALGRKFRSLDADAACGLLKIPALVEGHVILAFEDVQAVVQHVVSRVHVPSQDVRPVPANKIEANQLPSSLREDLLDAFRRTHLVEEFFRAQADPELADNLSAAFRERYARCRAASYDVEDTWFDLLYFIGGSEMKTARHALATVAVLAYYFHSCDIFERPAEATAS